jgi:4,5-dihydroxyphthalate decarboxylase
MGKLQLDLACGDYDRVRALRDGEVVPDGIELNFIAMRRPEEIFWRMLMHHEFHASEMSFGSYVAGRARGDLPFIAIPVFPSRMFRHAAIYVHAESGIEQPEDLKGKRVGVPEYQMTAATWVRGILQDDHGVHIQDVTWVCGGLEHGGRREKIQLALPPEIRLERIADTATLAAMLEQGQIDALISAQAPSPFLRRSPAVRRLFADYRSVEADYYRRTHIFPIMHTVVIRQDVYEAHPWVAPSLLEAFLVSKQQCLADMSYTPALRYMLPWLHDELERAQELMGDDYWPDGLEPNRHTLDTFARYSYEQGITQRQIGVDELFAAPTTDTFRT